MLNLHPLECTIKDNDHIPDLLLIKYWGIISCKYKSLLEFILIAYEPYFNGKQNWNLPFAKKEDFESGLIKIYSVFKKWGGINVFWQSYKPRFINH